MRVIQDRVVERIGSTKSQEVDVRIIAATNRDLLERVSAGKFREDLYYRLAVFPIAIPPLRERMEDVIPMAELFLERYGTTMGRPGLALSEDAKAAINAHRWPGNVRELENAVQRALLLCDGEAVMPEHLELRAVVARVTAGGGLAVNGSRGAAAELPAWGMEPPQAGVDFASTGEDQPADLETVEREHILRVLKTTGGNRKKAIDILGISERALRYKLKDYKEKGFYSGKD